MAGISRTARRRALAAAGVLVLTPFGRADAVAPPPVLEYEAAANGMALHIEINLPVPITLPVLGDVSTITQDISITSGSTSKAASEVTAVAKAVLGEGNVVVLSDLLALEAESSLGGPPSDSDEVSAAQVGPVGVGVGQISASVAPDSATTTLTSSARSSLASLRFALGALSRDAADTDLVRLSLLESTTNVTRTGTMATAQATASVGGLSILGGLVSLDAVKSESVSSANGITGAAAADTLTTVLGLKVADVLDISVTPDGVEGTVLGNALPPAAGNAIKDVIAAVNGVLATAGVQIIPGQETSTVDPSGRHAESSTEGLGIVVNPLKAAKPLVSVQLVPAGTAVRAAQVPQPEPRPSAPPAVQPPKPAPKPLPRTGADLPYVAAAGASLATAAALARRRRSTA